MAVTNIVHLSQLRGTTGKRIDAEYYDPESVGLERILKRTFCRTLRDFGASIDASAFYPSISEYYQNSGIPFIRVSDVRDGLVKLDEMVYLPVDVVDKFPAIRQALPGDMVITKGGTVGITALLADDFSRYALSRDLIVLRTSALPTKQAISIVLFLMGTYGRFQLLRGKSQQVQPHLTIPLIKNLIIPDLVIEQAVSDYLNSTKYLNKAELLYSQAENLLLEELGLKDFKPKYKLSYTANLSTAFGVHRVDAEYFQPIYEVLIEKIKEFELAKLGKIAERGLAKVRPNPDEIYKYIEISDIAIASGEVNYTERLGKELPPNARIPIDGGELIISKVRPTRGAISIVPEQLGTHVICTSAFSVFRVKPPLREYLYMVARSVIGKLQMERPTTGTSYPTIDDRDIENIVVPILSPQVQREIASLVQQSHDARRKAKALLEKAKRAVEIAIEEGEERAKQFLNGEHGKDA